MVDSKIYILPCSGIGKVLGSLGREAAYIVVDELRKGKTTLACLPLVVKGKQELIDEIKANKVITIDGCPVKCALNDVTAAAGKVDANFLTTDILKENRDLKPEDKVIPLGDNAKKLARLLAEKVAAKVDEFLEEE